MAKIGRNQPCPCGSGQKHKRCCGRHRPEERRIPPELPVALIKKALADERIRQNQQGLGKPIISAKHEGQQFVAVKNRLHFSKSWKTFPDFLMAYIKDVLGSEWGNAEIAKPEGDRHQIIQWYQRFCQYQQESKLPDGEIRSTEVNGLVSCYLGLAYNLYLLAHNVDLQTLMVTRLKDRSNFQGAFYELMIAGALIRAGYELLLEDETDRRTKHCEFAAIHKASGKRYSVEAKMRSVDGLLGKTEKDGSNDQKSLGKIITHLHGALTKPSEAERLVFIDINAPMDKNISEENRPEILDAAAKKIIAYENNPQAPDAEAFVFITNIAIHRYLYERPIIAVSPIGFRIADFNRPGQYSFAEKYSLDQKYRQLFDIADAVGKIGSFPSTFDGSLLSDNTPRGSERLQIGQTYNFTDAIPGGLIGTVRSAVVMEDTKTAHIVVNTPDGQGHILREQMSDAAFADYLENKEAYFGEIQNVRKTSRTPYEFFCRMMEIYADYDRAQLAVQMSMKPDDPRIAGMSDQQLREYISEQIVLRVTKSKTSSLNAE